MITLRRCLLLHLPTVTPHAQRCPRLADATADTSTASGQLQLLRNSSSSARQSKILRKLVTGKEKAKRRWYQDGPSTPKLVTAASLSNPARQGKNAPRRVHVLNKLFMKHITDLMSTGETADVLLGRGLQVSHVKVSADFNYVNVFWSTTAAASTTAKSDDSTTDELEAVLRLVAGQLRHELSQLRLMGEVPRIQFVRDRHMSSEAHMDALLARADFGPDYEPAGWAQLRQDLAQGERTARGTLPPMRHDVLGLNQADIMGKIRQTMMKSRQAWERYAEAGAHGGDSAGNAISNRVDVLDPAEGTTMTLAERRTELAEQTRQRDEEFAKFLEQRRFTRRLRVVQKNPDFRESYHRQGFDDDYDTEQYFDPSSGGDYIEEDGPMR